MKKIKRSYLALAIGFALAFTAPQAASAAGAACGTVTGAVYTHGSERGMKIASSPDASAGTSQPPRTSSTTSRPISG